MPPAIRRGAWALRQETTTADGDEDLFVTNIIGETFVLYRNDGGGNFEDARVQTGLGALTAAVTGFGTDWFDYDNDGWLDLFVANGAVNVIESQRGQPTPFKMKNQLFHNTGNGPIRRCRARGRAGLRTRRGQPRRRIRRHRQRRRHRHRRHDQRRAGAAADQPGHARAITGSTSSFRIRRAIALASAHASASTGPVSPHCGAAFVPTGATCQQATSARMPVLVLPQASMASSCSGSMARASGGRMSARTAS